MKNHSPTSFTDQNIGLSCYVAAFGLDINGDTAVAAASQTALSMNASIFLHYLMLNFNTYWNIR